MLPGHLHFFSIALLLAPDELAASAGPVDSGGAMDFVAYWAATRLLLSGGNPYSTEALHQLQSSVGLQAATPMVMWNPPWTLTFSLPFGLVDFSTSQFLWLLVCTLCIVFSAQKLWRIYGNPPSYSRKPWLLALTFPPTLFVLLFGQIPPLVLLGLTGFLYFEQRQNWLAAGAVLALVSVKPHFVYLFWIVLLLWSCERRLWLIPLGAVTTWLVAALIPLLFDPQIYSQYVELFRTTRLLTPLELPAPTLRNALRTFASVDGAVYGNLPTVFGVVWVVIYWYRNKDHWQWAEKIPLVLLVSICTTAYTWTFDQVALLPALLQAATWVSTRKLGWYGVAATVVYVLINLIYLSMKFVIIDDGWYFWMAPAFLATYLFARCGLKSDRTA